MIIDKASWHYCFISMLTSGVYRRIDICSYIRGFLLACLTLIMVVTVCGGLLYVGLWIPYSGLLMEVSHHPSLFAIASVIDIIALIIIISILYAAKGDMIDALEATPIGQYVKDRHNKICTLIEYK